MTTDEQKLEVINKAILNSDPNWDSYAMAKLILDRLKQFDQPTHEPLDVQIVEFEKFWYVEYLSDDGSPRWLKIFYSKQDAIDFCAKHGLSIKK